MASRKDIDVSFVDDEQAYPPIKPEKYRFTFGKHKDELLTEVPQDYLKCLLANDVKEPLKSLIVEYLKTNKN